MTAKTLLRDGFDVTIVERDSDLGGTWAPSRTYPGLRTNNSKFTYEFSDLSYAENVDTFPLAADVYAYLQGYAEKFRVLSRISFGTEAVNVSPVRGDSRLTVTLADARTGLSQRQSEYDFVAVCNGTFHQPFIPELKGLDRFSGRVLHSSQVDKGTYSPGDTVLVIGGGKSAFDCAAWAAGQGLAPTLVFRRAQWMAPRYLPGGRIPGDTLVSSRFLSAFLRYYRPSAAQKIMHSAGTPLVRAWWRLMARGWKQDLKIPKLLQPTERLPAGIEKIGVGDDFYRACNAGTARAVCNRVESFVECGVELADGSTLPADVVVFATGWRQDFSFLSKDIRDAVLTDGVHHLYRHILPPSMQTIGFVGYASSFSCTVTAEIAAHWLSEHFLGALDLPSEDQMEQEIQKAHEWSDRVLPERGTEGFLGPFISQYVDQLLGDLKLDRKRRRNPLTEYFGAFRASRYKGLSDERRLAREMNSAALQSGGG